MNLRFLSDDGAAKKRAAPRFPREDSLRSELFRRRGDFDQLRDSLGLGAFVGLPRAS